MKTAARIIAMGLALTLVACAGDDDPQAETAELAVSDTPAAAMPGAGMQGAGMQGGMGAMNGMAGMSPEMMGSAWQEHMAAMHAASGDSLQAMMPQHRQMATRMMEMMGSRMGMAMDRSWMATRDSLRQDLQRMQNMTAEEMDEFLDQHNARMQRMLQMYQQAPAQ